MACATCLSDCCVKPCVEELLCAVECCGCCDLPIQLAPNLDLHAGTIMGQRQSDLKYVAFDPAAVDGSQTPRGLLRYHVKTDADGNVINRYFGFLGLGYDSCGPKYTNMYFCGTFRLEDIVGDVASAAASNWLRLVDGFPGGSGIVRI